jgi:hypothetical protein
MSTACHQMNSPDGSQHDLAVGVDLIRISLPQLSVIEALTTDQLLTIVRNVDALSAMSSDGSSWVPTLRQYRPTYTKLSSSSSTPNFGSPFPRATTQPVLNAKSRRIRSAFPGIDHLHSAPTVASSGLAASVFSDDVSHPTPRPHRLSIRPRTRTPTRIPTPIPHISALSQVRSVSSPAAPQKHKEV